MADVPTAEDQLLSTAQVCALLCVVPRTLRRYVGKGELLPVRLTSRTNRYRVGDVAQYIVEHTEAESCDEVVTQALAFLAERQAEEERPLCPSCARRRVNRGNDVCTVCKQQAEDERHYKRNWWDEHGAQQRADKKRASDG